MKGALNEDYDTYGYPLQHTVPLSQDQIGFGATSLRSAVDQMAVERLSATPINQLDMRTRKRARKSV